MTLLEIENKWSKKAERLFKKADKMGDLTDAPIEEYREQTRIYNIASLISMFLTDLKKVK